MLKIAVPAFSVSVALFSTWKLGKLKLELEAEKLARKRNYDRDSRWIGKLISILTDEQWDEIRDFFMSEHDFYDNNYSSERT